jgi:hypothetical protein
VEFTHTMMRRTPRAALLFPPGWTLYSGGPHLALPGLRAWLEQQGVEVLLRDLNAEVSLRYSRPTPVPELMGACSAGSLDALNRAYFDAQDRFDAAAAPFDGAWDLRLGFTYRDLHMFSSRQSLEAARRESPFTEFYRRDVILQILDFRPDVVAFGLACIQQMIPTLQLCRALKEAGCQAVLVLGGNTVSRIADSVRGGELFRYVDCVALYQGEPVLPNLVEAAAAGQGLASVPSLVWWDGASVRRNRVLNEVDANAPPTPNFDGLDLTAYWGEPFLPLLAARGCYYGKCEFCAIPFGWGERRFAGLRSTELLVGDIERLVDRHGIRNLKFVDEAMPPSTIRRLAEALLERGIEVQWEAYTRLERAWADTDLAEVAARAGFVKGYFGVELVPGDHRDLLGKKDAGNPLETFRACRDNGVLVHMFSMLGFPGTSVEEARRTVEFALSNVDLIDTLDVFAYGYARGTPVPKGAEIVREPDLDWALEYPYRGLADGVLSSPEVDNMVTFYEEVVFERQPRLAHPVYRLVSPWCVAPGRSSELATAQPATLSAAG